MKRSSVKELLIFVLWILTDIVGVGLLARADLANYLHHFALSVVILFEMYIFLQLPGAKYFWNAVEHGEDPNHRKIRLAAMACIVALLIFVFKWYFFLSLYFIATIRIDGIINFFRVSHEERHRILETEGIPELKTYLYIIAGFPIAVALFAVAFLACVFHSSPTSSVKSPHQHSYKLKNLQKPADELKKIAKEAEEKKKNKSVAQDIRKTQKSRHLEKNSPVKISKKQTKNFHHKQDIERKAI